MSHSHFSLSTIQKDCRIDIVIGEIKRHKVGVSLGQRYQCDDTMLECDSE